MVEKDWITKAGLRAVCYVCSRGGRKKHRCGYVEVPQGHPLYGVAYVDQIPQITQEEVASQTIGKKSPIIALTAGVNSDGDGLVRRSPDILFDVHGGLTYSGGKDGYPVEGSTGWWFGFDCAHHDDGEIEPDPRFDHGGEVRSEQYVVNECESLAAQIVAKFPIKETV